MTESFPLFPRLPFELRTTIWEAAISDVKQVLEAYVVEQDHDGHADCIAFLLDRDADGNLRSPYPGPLANCVIVRRLLVFPYAASGQIRPPAVLSVSREARHVGLQYGSVSQLWLDRRHEKPHPVHLSSGLENTIVFIPNFEKFAKYGPRKKPPLENPEHLTPIRHLALEWSFFPSGSSPPGCPVEVHRFFWKARIYILYSSCPNLTDIYCCVPGLRRPSAGSAAEVDLHSEEPPGCAGLPIRLEPMDPERAFPSCRCASQQCTWPNIEAEIDEVFASEWLRASVQSGEFGGSGFTFPPRVHGCMLLREGLDLEKVKKEKTRHGCYGSEIEEDF